MARPRWDDYPIEVAPLLFLDIETSGLHPNRGARITEIAAFDHERLRVYGNLTPSAATYDAVLTEQLEHVFETLRGGIAVGHHLAFDLHFLAREADRLRQTGPQVWYIDTLSLAQRLALRTSDHRLGTLLRYFGCLPDAPLHTARVDARATRTLFWHLVDRGSFDTVGELGVTPFAWVGR